MTFPYNLQSFGDRPIPYAEALDLQYHLQALRRESEACDTLLLLEHCPVITIGRGSHPETDFLTPPSKLIEAGIDIFEADRGGELTYHAPGQLIGYPILMLDDASGERDLHKYLRNLELVIIDTLRDIGIVAVRKPGLTGVWVGDDKIAAMGIKVSRWVTMHGFSINIDLDLSPMRVDIVPCGIREHGVTSIRELGIAIDRSGLEEVLVSHFERILNRKRRI